MLRPAGSVSLYFPNRSTIPARAWGTIRIVLASRGTTKRNSRTSRMSTISAPMGTPSALVVRRGRGANSGLDARYRMDVRRGSADLQDLDGAPRLDGERLVVRLGRPDLAGQLDPSGLEPG